MIGLEIQKSIAATPFFLQQSGMTLELKLAHLESLESTLERTDYDRLDAFEGPCLRA